MTQLEALKELLEKVKAGDNFGILPLGERALGDGNQIRLYTGEKIASSFEGSMDAALSLFDAVLPGCYAMVETDGTATVGKYCGDHESFFGDCYTDDSANPSRALLIAILKAKIAEFEA